MPRSDNRLSLSIEQEREKSWTRTGFEPVTSSVSGNSGVSVTVGLSSSGEPLTCTNILSYVALGLEDG